MANKSKRISKQDSANALCPYYCSSNAIRITCNGGDAGVLKTTREFKSEEIKKNYFSRCRTFDFRRCPIYLSNLSRIKK